jgi:hypothetical protein
MPGSVPLPVMWNNVAELGEFQLKLGQSEGSIGTCDVPLQTLVRLVKEEEGGVVFGPEDIAVMATAFDRLLAEEPSGAHVASAEPSTFSTMALVKEVPRRPALARTRAGFSLLGCRRYASPSRLRNSA